MNAWKQNEIRLKLQTLEKSCRTTIVLFEQVAELLRQASGIQLIENGEIITGTISVGKLKIDNRLFTISFRGKSCFLGNSLPFQLLRRLARSPDVYISREELLESIWGGKRSVSAIKSVLSDLRQKLRANGMSELAASLEGSARGYYMLRVPHD